MNYFIIGHNIYPEATMSSKESQNVQSKNARKESIEQSQFVLKMLRDLPRDLRSMFLPKHADDIAQLDQRIARFETAQEDRDQVIHLQHRFGLPLRPNMSLQETAARVRIAVMKQEQSEDPSSSIFEEDSPFEDLEY